MEQLRYGIFNLKDVYNQSKLIKISFIALLFLLMVILQQEAAIIRLKYGILRQASS